MKYIKKQVVIEAFKLRVRQLNWPGWALNALTNNTIIAHNTGKFHNPTEESFLIIKTLEGDHKANLGDFIIKGVKGEIYSCKPDIFEMTYERVEQLEHLESPDCWCEPTLIQAIDDEHDCEVWSHKGHDELNQ
jgi:hypothetical protein